MQLGLERILVDGGYGAYSTHFGAVAEDGRFARLPLAAASSLMAKGYGFSAEGDGLTAALMSAAQNLIGETQFTEMYAMDFSAGRVPDEPHGRGELGARPRRRAGEVDQAAARDRRPRRPADLPLPLPRRRRDAGDARRPRRRALPAASSPRERSSTPTSCRGWRCHTGSSGRTPACETASTAWLRSGGPHHQVLNLGRRAAEWRLFGEAAGIEVVLV